MECCIPVNDASETRTPFEVLDAEFFDDSVFIIVYREGTQPGESPGPRPTKSQRGHHL